MGLNFSALEIGRQALRAGQLGLNVTSQNIANVNTPGYTRQLVHLAARPASAPESAGAGGGVAVADVRAVRDQFIEGRLQKENAITGRWTAQRDALQPLDAVLNDSNNQGGISAALTIFFGAFRELEAQPNSPALRSVAVQKGIALTSAFQSADTRLREIRQDANGYLRSAVEDVNQFAERVASLNAKILRAENTEGSVSELVDQRDEVVSRLAELTGARAITDARNQVTLTLEDGRALVIGEKSFRLEAEATAPDGLSRLTIAGEFAEIGDGRLRGWQNAANNVSEYLSALDELAASVAERVNAQHVSGVDLNGDAGTDFFVAGDGGAVTAFSLEVADSLKNDSRKVVVAAAGNGNGDATIAREIASLLTDNTSTAGTRQGSFVELYAGIVRDAGEAIRTADDALNTQQAILAQIQAQDAAISGVSLDEEAVNLLQYQRAFEAAARFMRIADEMTQTIISLVQ